jgi:hypothetical protein
MEETEIMQYTFEAIGLLNPAGQWKVVPSPQDMVNEVAQDQNAIGIVPAYALTDEVKVLSVNGLEFESVPVLAVWNHEPTTAEQEWLLCLQEELN